MDTQTHVAGTKQQIREFAADLIGACNTAIGEPQHVQETFEQADGRGPWRIIITVVPEDEVIEP